MSEEQTRNAPQGIKLIPTGNRQESQRPGGIRGLLRKTKGLFERARTTAESWHQHVIEGIAQSAMTPAEQLLNIYDHALNLSSSLRLTVTERDAVFTRLLAEQILQQVHGPLMNLGIKSFQQSGNNGGEITKQITQYGKDQVIQDACNKLGADARNDLEKSGENIEEIKKHTIPLNDAAHKLIADLLKRRKIHSLGDIPGLLNDLIAHIGDHTQAVDEIIKIYLKQTTGQEPEPSQPRLLSRLFPLRRR